jgi:two-component system, chemotaxis family, chemotaxis protein CheY
MKALVIDDSRAMRVLLGGVLKKLGYEVSEAGNGQEGLHVIREKGRPDVALVDWNMPVMGGFEFVKAVRADPSLTGLPLVMVTTETEMDQMSAALAAGANEYVLKPFTRDGLREKLENLGLVGTPA